MGSPYNYHHCSLKLQAVKDEMGPSLHGVHLALHHILQCCPYKAQKKFYKKWIALCFFNVRQTFQILMQIYILQMIKEKYR